MTTPQLPKFKRAAQRVADDRTREQREARFISHGMIGTHRLDDAEREYAATIALDAATGSAIEAVEGLPAARAEIDRDPKLTAVGKREAAAGLASDAAGNVQRAFSSVARRVAADLTTALDARDRLGADPASGGQIQATDVVADYGRDGQLAGFVAIDVANRIDLLRREMLTADAAELREQLRASAAAGDSLTMVAADSLPALLHKRIRERAGLDSEAWKRLRRTYREARDPQGAARIAVLAGVAERVSSNAMAARAQIEKAGAIERDAQLAFDAILEPLREAVKRARS